MLQIWIIDELTAQQLICRIVDRASCRRINHHLFHHRSTLNNRIRNIALVDHTYS